MDPEMMEQLKQRTAELPAVVRNAIATIDVQKQLRSVSDRHKLHLDQWSKLENEVLLTLLGFASPADLATNIEKVVSVSSEDAEALAQDVNSIIFEPIRQELERELEHPDAQEKPLSEIEAAGKAALSQENAAQGVQPATPPAPKPTEKAVRTPISSAYTSRQPSTERKDIAGDPYRESPL